VANLDTAAKRLSGINVSCPWRGFFPLPDGAITSAADRQTAAYYYSGINPSVAPNSGSGIVTGVGEVIGAGYRTSEGSGVVEGTGTVIGASLSTARTAGGGVRRARFLRRAPRLPWEEDPEETQESPQVTVDPPKRKRIRMPALEAIRSAKPIPIQTIKAIDAPSISIPELGTAQVQIDDDDDDWLWLI
jgi:hypothetical protein